MSTIPGEIVQALRDAREAAYAPYSNFGVAAVAVSADGHVFPGCNVETAHYKSVCAEASAISAMISTGRRELNCIYILGPEGRACPPCGDCRQRIREFALDHACVILVDQTGRELQRYTVDQLLPHAFGPNRPATD